MKHRTTVFYIILLYRGMWGILTVTHISPTYPYQWIPKRPSSSGLCSTELGIQAVHRENLRKCIINAKGKQTQEVTIKEIIIIDS